MKSFNILFLILIIFCSKNISQDVRNVSEFTSQSVKIYPLIFIDSNNRWAESFLGNTL
jgi:hypothetical protein